MRKLLSLVAGGLLAFSLAAPAAQSVPFTGSLGLVVGALPPIPIPGAGSGPSTGGGIAGITSGGFLATATVPVVNPTFGNLAAFPIVSIKLGTPVSLVALSAVAGGGAACAGGAPGGFNPGAAAGIGDCSGVGGVAKIGLFGPPPLANLTVPLAVLGAGGTTAVSAFGVMITAVGAGWTTGVGAVIGSTNPTTPTIGAATGGDFRTPGGLGTVVLVSPLLAIVNIAGSTNLPLFGVLTLNYVPEPGTLLLLGSGVAGLALLGRKRIRG